MFAFAGKGVEGQDDDEQREQVLQHPGGGEREQALGTSILGGSAGEIMAFVSFEKSHDAGVLIHANINERQRRLGLKA
uniref:hypothetical protein n=1 Tax=Chloracidobacterium thermophilum TaxID=458033 RepID=UPI002017386D|nr:hypothetical protein [Chloracidobacterium thermophilum]